MTRLVQEKKKACWQRFCEDNGDKDVLEVTKWAKDPWRLNGTMGKLIDIEGRRLESDE